MPKQRTDLEAAAGKLILAIQQEWDREIGEPSAAESEAVMHSSHGLLQAAKSNAIEALLDGRSVAQYLGPSWVGRHPRVSPAIKSVELLIKVKHAV
jgi:hypothetical protein